MEDDKPCTQLALLVMLQGNYAARHSSGQAQVSLQLVFGYGQFKMGQRWAEKAAKLWAELGVAGFRQIGKRYTCTCQAIVSCLKASACPLKFWEACTCVDMPGENKAHSRVQALKDSQPCCASADIHSCLTLGCG